ncbi:GNAT family N-acetyltransferase [Pontibacter sp. BAB1700]|uniref:GNAT family N-acetyltransferase n=1 Tax=Pontibacter sp. BAB1700 TaxID=1144253 RepID=UPI00026BD1FE|nr:N-acetyltransferase GCN5 [Pontibacter sp. BAB1700]
MISLNRPARHYLATCEGIACGAARWRQTDQGIKLERFAVLADYRNRQVGAALLQAVLRDVQAAHAGSKVYLNAQLPAVNFYKRHGFVTEATCSRSATYSTTRWFIRADETVGSLPIRSHCP